MPTYDYECASPEHHRFERFQRFSDPPVQECPECGASVRRVIHPVGVVFKGPGFYKTDTRPKSEAASDEKPATDGKPAEAKDDSKKPVEKAKPEEAAPAPTTSE